MKIVKILFVGHLAALAFGLGGLLIALPHPELWNRSPLAGEVFLFGIHYAGSLHILFGAATVLLFGLLLIGPQKTLIFFAASTLISLGIELLGTSTGFPFGAYSYTDFLGFKVAGLVPYSIPLSWFYMGFTGYILASAIISKLQLRHQTLWSLLLGAYFLTAWDLALDPAMASEHLPIHFWIWHDVGPYFGMPIRNLVGWTVNGLIYMSVSRLFWRTDLDTQRLTIWLPFGVYAANIIFAIGLNLNVGLWLPSIMAVIFGLLPASLALLLQTKTRSQETSRGSNAISQAISWRVLRLISRRLVQRNLALSVEGLEHLPSAGPVLIVARHVHHLYDGCILLSVIPRPLHILVALDWIKQRPLRRLMEQACRIANWPIVLRSERFRHTSANETSIYTANEARPYLRRAVINAIGVLREDKILVIFPEAYPNIDPAPTPKSTIEAFLPFRSGFARLVERAEQDKQTPVAIIPTGLTYRQDARWQVCLRFGPALYRHEFTHTEQFIRAVEARVHVLSHTVSDPPCPATTEEVSSL